MCRLLIVVGTIQVCYYYKAIDTPSPFPTSISVQRHIAGGFQGPFSIPEQSRHLSRSPTYHVPNPHRRPRLSVQVARHHQSPAVLVVRLALSARRRIGTQTPLVGS
jgi:hypothetical protein